MVKKSKEEALGEDQLTCVLSGNVVRATQKELNLQSVIGMMNEEYGAALKSLADSEGIAVSAFVAGMVHERVKGHKLDAAERAWIAEHLEMNLIRRAKADAKTAGYHKRKLRGHQRTEKT